MKQLDLVHRRKLWYTISVVAIVPGIISLFLFGLKLGIDFKGGAVLEINAANVDIAAVNNASANLGFRDVTVTPSGSGTLIRYRDDSAGTKQEENHQTFKKKLADKGYKEVSYSVVGPSVSKDISRNALLSILVASIMPNLASVLLLMLVVGGLSVIFIALGNTTLQLASEPSMRGRVMAMWGVAFLGTTPIGGPIIGFISDHTSPRIGLATGGISALIAAAVGRHIYRQQPKTEFISAEN